MTKYIITAAIVGIAAAIGYASYYFLGPDNAVEEACEQIVQEETGAEIDISPSTPETPEIPTGNKAAS